MVIIKSDIEWDVTPRFYNTADQSCNLPNFPPVAAQTDEQGVTWPVSTPQYYIPDISNVPHPSLSLSTVSSQPNDASYGYMMVKYDRRNGQMSAVSRLDASDNSENGAQGKLDRLQTTTSSENVQDPLSESTPSFKIPCPRPSHNREVSAPLYKLLKHRRVCPDKPVGVIKRRPVRDVPVIRHDTHRSDYVLVGDYATIESHIRLRFNKIQQNPLKPIAKAIIQRVEPCKQRYHPYTMSKNGKKGGDKRSGKDKDIPTTNRSPWWPAGIEWKEPDHLSRHDRTALLVHIVLMCIKNPQQYRACLGEDDSCRCRHCDKFHKTWADVMDCTLEDDQLDLRNTPSKNKDNPTENGNPKIPARREVLKEIFRLAAEVERCELGMLDKSQKIRLYPIPPILAKENTKTRTSRITRCDEDDEDSICDDDDETRRNPPNETSALYSASSSPTKEAVMGSGYEPVQYQPLAAYEGLSFSRALSATSGSQSASPYGFDRLSLQEGMGYLPIPQVVPEMVIGFQQPLQSFQHGDISGNQNATLLPFQHTYQLSAAPSYGTNNIYQWPASTTSVPCPYNNGFVGFAVPDSSAQTQPSISFNSIAYPNTANVQSWQGYCELPSENGMKYWSEAYPQPCPQPGMMYSQ